MRDELRRNYFLYAVYSR